MRHAVRCAGVACAFLVIMGLAAGCASQTKTIQTERTVQSSGQAVQDSPAQAAVVEARTVVETRHEPQGVLSTTVHLVGEVLALPFRLIAGLIRLVF